MAKIRKHIKVCGRVQGVGFRFFTRSAASMTGVRGFVKNLPDGSVEIEAEGTPEQMGLFLQKVEEGPSYGNVEKTEIKPETNRVYTGFGIEY
ncbi:MAG: acylphosphatase [Fibrobacterota bacterium]